MRKYSIIILFGLILSVSCTDLDLNPLSEGSSENWYSTAEEIEMSLNGLFDLNLWQMDMTDETKMFDKFTDDWTGRTSVGMIGGDYVTSEWSKAKSTWTNAYKAITRANNIIAGLANASGVSEDQRKMYEALARCVRAYEYGFLITHFGDVPYPAIGITLEEAYEIGRKDKNEILGEMYSDFDFAIENLPVSYGGSQNKYLTKGAAYGLKARYALYMGDWQTAANAANGCIELGTYELYPEFGDIFLIKNKQKVQSEIVFSLPRDKTFDIRLNRYAARQHKTRMAGGYTNDNPSWELFCAFLCTDGLPIDESSLFDPREPFKNRDPRCSATIVEFGSRHLGFEFNPHPEALTCLNYSTGLQQKNEDNRNVYTKTSYNAMAWKKGVDEDWIDVYTVDPDKIIMRFADVLLMYAEAKIELNEIDQSVLDAINMVRARAYGVDKSNIAAYPSVTTMDQGQLRKIVRLERRMELAHEGIRYMDIIRWRLAEKVLTRNIYGLLNPADIIEKVVKPGLWFYPEVPVIDEDGCADFLPMYEKGYIRLLGERRFDKSKQYLWPIPDTEININPKLEQNPGY